MPQRLLDHLHPFAISPFTPRALLLLKGTGPDHDSGGRLRRSISPRRCRRGSGTGWSDLSRAFRRWSRRPPSGPSSGGQVRPTR